MIEVSEVMGPLTDKEQHTVYAPDQPWATDFAVRVGRSSPDIITPETLTRNAGPPDSDWFVARVSLMLRRGGYAAGSAKSGRGAELAQSPKAPSTRTRPGATS